MGEWRILPMKHPCEDIVAERDQLRKVVEAVREELIGPGLGGSGTAPYPSALRSCPKTVAALMALTHNTHSASEEPPISLSDGTLQANSAGYDEGYAAGEAERDQLREERDECRRLSVEGFIYKPIVDDLRAERDRLREDLKNLHASYDAAVYGHSQCERNSDALIDRYRAALEGLVRHVGVCDRRHYSGDVWECSYVIEARRTLADPTEAPHG